jgi:uncharacterized low-complexity protein
MTIHPEDPPMSNKLTTTLSLAAGAALLGSLSIGNAATAFQVSDLGSGYMLVADDNKPEGKCGEGKCGEGKCGGDAAAEGQAAAPAADAKAEEGKCGEGKCGDDKGKEKTCGASA